MERGDTFFLNALIQRNEAKFSTGMLGEEMVMMNMDNGDFLTMNKVGADIWSSSVHPVPVRDIIAQLIDRYQISEDQCINETIQFLQSTVKQNMFLITNTVD